MGERVVGVVGGSPFDDVALGLQGKYSVAEFRSGGPCDAVSAPEAGEAGWVIRLYGDGSGFPMYVSRQPVGLLAAGVCPAGGNVRVWDTEEEATVARDHGFHVRKLLTSRPELRAVVERWAPAGVTAVPAVAGGPSGVADGAGALTSAELATIEARVLAATPGPWAQSSRETPLVHSDMCVTVAMPDGLGFGVIASVNRHVGTPNDAAFIAHAREDLHRLLAALRAAEARAGLLEAALAASEAAREALEAVAEERRNGCEEKWLGGLRDAATAAGVAAERARLVTVGQGVPRSVAGEAEVA